MLLEILAATAFLCAVGSSSSGKRKQAPKRRKSADEEYWFVDGKGNEHYIDDDGYCEECDEDHDC